MKAILFALFIGLLLVGCGTPSPQYVSKIREQARKEQLEREAMNPKKDAIETAVDWLKLQGGQVTYLANTREPFSGYAKQAYDNKQIKILAQFKDGKRDGLSTEWNEEGQKMTHENHKDGFRNGLSTAWDENGQMLSESNWKDGERDGITTVWYDNGLKMSHENYKDGKLMFAVIWKPNGEKCPLTKVKAGNGVWVWYKTDGTEPRHIIYKDGMADPPLSPYFQLEIYGNYPLKEIKYLSYELDGLLKEVDADAQKLLSDIEEQTTQETKKENDTAVDFSELHDREGVTYLLSTDNPYTGYATLHKNGLKGSKMFYKEGKPHGLWTKWYKNGQKMTEMNFDEGKPSGTWTEWYENDQKKSETTWKDGKRNGFAIFYNMDGTEECRESYKDDKRVKD
jgi:antitoxin component YwqK of YwqJK toxin-antitoxin module